MVADMVMKYQIKRLRQKIVKPECEIHNSSLQNHELNPSGIPLFTEYEQVFNKIMAFLNKNSYSN